MITRSGVDSRYVIAFFTAYSRFRLVALPPDPVPDPECAGAPRLTVLVALAAPFLVAVTVADSHCRCDCRRVPCTCCNREPPHPPDIGEFERSRIAALFRSGRPIDTVREIRRAAGLGLGDAKFVLDHLTVMRGRCNVCRATLGSAAHPICAKCGGAQFDW